MKVKTSFDVGKLFSYWSHTDWVCLLEIGQIILKKLLSAVDRLNFLSPPCRCVGHTIVCFVDTIFTLSRTFFSLVSLSPYLFIGIFLSLLFSEWVLSSIPCKRPDRSESTTWKVYPPPLPTNHKETWR